VWATCRAVRCCCLRCCPDTWFPAVRGRPTQPATCRPALSSACRTDWALGQQGRTASLSGAHISCCCATSSPDAGHGAVGTVGVALDARPVAAVALAVGAGRPAVVSQPTCALQHELPLWGENSACTAARQGWLQRSSVGRGQRQAYSCCGPTHPACCMSVAAVLGVAGWMDATGVDLRKIFLQQVRCAI
jgi:hypothetical protein